MYEQGDSYMESTEEDEYIPSLNPLTLDYKKEKIQRPKQIFTFQGNWEGLDVDTPIIPEDYKEPDIVHTVKLPNISTEIESIPASPHESIDEGAVLSQDYIFKVIEKIDTYKLSDSIVGGKKAGYNLSELNSFAKQLGLIVTGLKKTGIAQRILDRIRLEVEEINDE